MPQNLRVAVPNKGTLSEPAAAILSEAGYRRRTDAKDLTVVDPVNQVEFFFLRPKDIAIYVGSGQLDVGITGRDLALESDAPVRERLALGFGSSTFRYAAPAGRTWQVGDLAGRRIATSFPNLVRKDLAARGIEATVIRLDGAVEISVQLGVADAIADVVGSGRTLGRTTSPRSATRCATPRRCSSSAPTTAATPGRTQRAISWWPGCRGWCSVSSI